MPVVSLEGVSKKYRILFSRRDRLKRALSFGKSKVGQDFWALKDINLKVEAGTALGILGRNGAGKTTLLQTISGVLRPTSGTIRVDGRLMALFQLGAGFEDEFTGRENVMLNGLILGIDRKEMLERLDEIEAFAEIGDFVDQPLKTYSSGMRARLGFAVAVNVEPDILIVDEALSTGDAVFKAKGIQKMRELRDSGTTILFVSHSTNQVREFCTEAVLLHKGSLVASGDAGEIADYYHGLLSNAADKRDDRFGLDRSSDSGMAWDNQKDPRTTDFKESPKLDKGQGLRYGTGDAKIQAVELLDEHGRPVDVVVPESELTVRVHAQYAKDVDDSSINVILRNEVGLDIFSTNTNLEKTPVGKRRAGEQVIVDFTFQVPLKRGRYSIVAAVSRPGSEDRYLDWLGVAAVFSVPRSPGNEAFKGLVHLPTRVEVFEPDRVGERKPPD